MPSKSRRRATPADFGALLGEILGPVAREGVERLAASEYGPIVQQVLPVHRQAQRATEMLVEILTAPPAEPEVIDAEFVDDPPPPRRR